MTVCGDGTSVFPTVEVGGPLKPRRPLKFHSSPQKIGRNTKRNAVFQASCSGATKGTPILSGTTVDHPQAQQKFGQFIPKQWKLDSTPMDTTPTYVLPQSQALKEQFAGIVDCKTLTKQ